MAQPSSSDCQRMPFIGSRQFCIDHPISIKDKGFDQTYWPALFTYVLLSIVEEPTKETDWKFYLVKNWILSEQFYCSFFCVVKTLGLIKTNSFSIEILETWLNKNFCLFKFLAGFHHLLSSVTGGTGNWNNCEGFLNAGSWMGRPYTGLQWADSFCYGYLCLRPSRNINFEGIRVFLFVWLSY